VSRADQKDDDAKTAADEGTSIYLFFSCNS